MPLLGKASVHTRADSLQNCLGNKREWPLPVTYIVEVWMMLITQFGFQNHYGLLILTANSTWCITTILNVLRFVASLYYFNSFHGRIVASLCVYTFTHIQHLYRLYMSFCNVITKNMIPRCIGVKRQLFASAFCGERNVFVLYSVQAQCWCHFIFTTWHQIILTNIFVGFVRFLPEFNVTQCFPYNYIQTRFPLLLRYLNVDALIVNIWYFLIRNLEL